MKKFNETMMLQVTVAVLALVPISAGLSGVIFGSSFLDAAPIPVNFDSHFRYLSGLLLAIGYGFWSCIPHIKRKTDRFRLLTLIVFLGGIARFTALLLNGSPGPSMLFGLGMELVVTPLLCLWQARIARKFF